MTDGSSSSYDLADAAADIAVIGMAGRFPGARDLTRFWENIANGVESIAVLSDAELAAAGVPESVRRSPGYVPVSSRLDDVDRFDAEFFGYSPREAALLDPQGRVGLELAWHALEDAGYDSLDYRGAIGVFASASLSTYLLQNLAGRLDAQDFVLGLGNIPIVLGNGPDFAATRVSYKLNLRGPSQSVQTACSSSLAAIHLARQSLLNGECDMALAGGVSIYLPQDRGYRWQEGMILSSDGHVRAFDADADGVVFGRGGGVVVLKPLARALEDGDRIRAVIKGSAMNNDGSRKAGFTAPSVTGQSRVITEALADAGVRADSISYVEAHGTGTALGDPIEVAGLTEAFRKHTTRTGYCALGTVKTNIGHLDVAAGVTALIKTVLMLEHRQLPPSLHYRRPNPAIDFGSSPFFVNTSLRPWEGVAGTRRAGVSAFGIGGTNVHLVVEEARSPARTDHRALRPMQLMRVTARTDEALATLCGALADRLTGAGEMELADVSYTANTGRAHQARRVAVRGTSALEMSDGLLAAARGEDDPRVVRGLAAQNDAPPVAFLFTGLGAQSAGMGASLFRSEPVFRGALERCDVLLRPYLARPLLSVIYPPEGEPSPIDETTYGQPVMFAFEYALAELWKSWGVRPAALLGHSLGEYAAACVSGLLSLDDALRLVSTRARLADSLPAGGGMAAVFASEEQVRDAIGRDADRVWIASVNGPQSQVMSGAVDALARVAARLAEQHVEVRMLNVAQAFHSGMLEPMLDEYEAALSRTRFGRAETPIISNVTGAVLADADGRTARYWRRHAREAVRFADGVMTLYARGIRHFLEIGPHTTAMAMAAGCLTDDGVVFVPSLRRGRDDFDQLFETVSTLYVGGVDVTWAEFHATHAGRRVALPLYPFARTRHWIDTGAAPVPADRESPMGPLLGPQVRSPLIGVPVYDLRIGAAAQPFLGDHQVFGATVFPATAYIEAALEAAEAAGGRRATVVEGIEITEPLILPPGNTPRVQVILRPEAGCDAFEIVSQPSDDAAGASWRRHASGRVARNGASAPGAAARLDLDAVRTRCGAAVSGEQFYAGLAAQGFGYGPSFRGLGRLWLGDGEILGEVELPAILDGEPGAFQFHPALLDACLQSVLGLAPLGRAFVPTGVERVELRDWEPHLFAHAVRRAGPVEARVFFADVRIANARGEIVAALEGIALHEASAQKWRTDVGDVWESWLYEPTWRQMAPPEDSAAAGLRGTSGRQVGRKYLLVSDESSAAAGFAKCVRDAGATACVVSHAALIEHGVAVLDAATADGSVDAVIVVAAQNPNAPVAAAHDPTTGTRALLSVVQWLIGDSSSSGARLWIVTGGAQGVVVGDAVAGVFDAPMWGLATVVSLEHPELRCSCIDVESAADIPADAIWREVTADSAETRIAYRGGVRHVARLARPARAAKSAANIARRLTSIEPGALDGLRYADEPRRAPRAGEVEILVRAAGLNFKDVLTALGRYRDASAALGHECAGEVVAVGAGTSSFAVGDAVVAFVAGSLATHVTADARLVAHLPATLSFEQGATVTGAFLTAQYALHDLAKLGAGDRVLIHAATGGVGLAAVQIAQRAGATIFATAGSESKRALLVSLGVTHVFNSRNAEFAPAIAALTHGRGVTVVLNSLTGEMLERSAELLVDGGRFVELGMATSQSAGAAEVLARRASYFNPNVAREAAADPPRFGGMLRDLLAAIERGELRPLPVQAFDADDAISAFRLMARAGHVGKLAIRENSPIGAAAAGARPPAQMAPDASYLIVGGLGGLGSVLIPWLVERGARHIAVMTRRDPSVEEARSLSELAERGVQLVVVRADVSSRDAVDAALARIAEAMPPLRGVIHAAGVLDDGALGRQTWERFARVMAPKVAGSWNLHEATSNVDLDFFILFSSVASVLGSKGQANHAAANAFLDALAHHRRAGGLPALSINWGAWSGVGAAAQRAIGDRIASRGWGEIRPDEGLAAFGRLLGWPRPQIAVAPIDWRVYAGEFAEEHAPPLLADLMREDGVAASPPAGRTARESVGPTVAADVRAVSPGERRAVIERFLRGQVGKVLGLAPNRHVDADTPLIDLGLDSLLAVELRNTLSRGLALPRRLPATLLFDYPTIATLSEHLLSMIVEQSPARAVPEPAAVVERSGTLPSFERAVDDRDIAELTDEEAEALLLRELE